MGHDTEDKAKAEIKSMISISGTNQKAKEVNTKIGSEIDAARLPDALMSAIVINDTKVLDSVII
jgi:hypothetical protein